MAKFNREVVNNKVIAVFVLLLVALDQWVKHIISSTMVLGESRSFIPGLVRLTYVENRGAAFGLFKDWRIVLIILTSLVVLGLAWVLLKKIITHRLGVISTAMVIGGALGNLVDRIIFGRVVDMFEFEFINFAIFNVADIFLSVGGVLLCIYLVFFDPRFQGKKGKGKHEVPR